MRFYRVSWLGFSLILSAVHIFAGEASAPKGEIAPRWKSELEAWKREDAAAKTALERDEKVLPDVDCFLHDVLGRPVETVPRPELYSFGAFTESVAWNWNYECPGDFRYLHHLDRSHAEDDMRAFIQSAIIVGLRKLDELNPELVTWILGRVKGRALTFTASSIDHGVFGKYTPRPLIADKIELSFPATFAVQEGMRNRWIAAGNKPYDIAGRTFVHGPGKGILSITWIDMARGHQANIVFHEFLHFAGLPIGDNHNDGLAPDEPATSRREADMVFACAAQAFPYGELRRKPGSKHRYFGNSRLACETCAASTLGIEGQAQREMALKRGKKKCEGIDPMDFQRLDPD